MKKHIKIFLASSITEFHNERMELNSFIESISRKFRKSYDIDIEPFICENYDPCLEVEGRKQAVYNSELKTSDMVFFIFFTKCGKFTREEFELARETLAQKGFPKIYTYFKKLSENENMEESLKDFMVTLDESIGHYHCEFDHLDTIKLRILLNLKLQEMDFVEIKVEDGNCFVDGKIVMSVDNVSEFANNKILKDLKDELLLVENRYYALKKEESRSKEEENEYADLATRRNNLTDAIRELQKDILNMSLRMCKDEIRGEITSRQKEAYRLFEIGDIKGANRILDFEEIKSDYLHNSGMYEKSAEIFIKEVKTKIDVLKLMTDYPARYDEAECLYDEVVPVALRTETELEIVLEYIWFLRWQNKHEKALKISKKLELLYEIEETPDNDEGKAKLYRAMATLYYEMPYKEKEAEKYIDKAVDKMRSYVLCECLTDGTDVDDPYKFRFELGSCCNMAGCFYHQRNRYEEAERSFFEAIEIFEKLAEENPEKYNQSLAGSYSNIASIYRDNGILDRADLYNALAISIRKKLVEENPGEYYYDLSSSYNNIGTVKVKQGELDWAEIEFSSAIMIREELYRANPQGYANDLADVYINVAVVYKKQNRKEEAEEFFLKAIEIYKKIAEKNPDRFDEGLARACREIAIFYDYCGLYEKAEDFYLKAIATFERLAEKSPERFLPYLAVDYFFYGVSGETKEEYLEKAVEIMDSMPDHPLFKDIIDFFDGK